MKRIKGLLIIGFALILYFLPGTIMNVNAANFTISASSKVKSSSNVTFTISAANFGSGFGSATLNVKYDSTKFSFVSATANQGSITQNPTAGNIGLVITKADGMSNGKIITVVLKSAASANQGNSSVSVEVNDCYDTTGVNAINASGGSTAINFYSPSTTATLSSLTINGVSLSPAFDKNTFYYTSSTAASSVTVNATASDVNSKVSGTGKKDLDYGENKITVKVVAEAGSAYTKSYEVKIVRTDNRSTDNTLTNLTVSNTDITFDSTKTTYTANVGLDVKEVTITGSADLTATIFGNGTFQLAEGENNFLLTITAQNGTSTVYTIKIIKETSPNVAGTTLKSLTINNKIITLNDSNTYLFGIDYSTNSIDIKCEPSSTTAKCEIKNNTELKAGINRVEIVVTEEDESSNTYYILVNRSEEIKTIEDINSLEELNENTKYSTKEDQIIIKKTTLDLLLNNENKLYIDKVNEYNGLLYQIELNRNIIFNNDYTMYIYKANNKPLTYTASIPTNARVKLYLESINSGNVYLYSYNQETNEYILLESELTVDNNYVTFTSKGSNQYVFSTTPIENKKSTTSLQEWITRIQYFIVGGIISIIVYVFIKNKKALKQEKIKQEQSKQETLF